MTGRKPKTPPPERRGPARSRRHGEIALSEAARWELSERLTHALAEVAAARELRRHDFNDGVDARLARAAALVLTVLDVLTPREGREP